MSASPIWNELRNMIRPARTSKPGAPGRSARPQMCGGHSEGGTGTGLRPVLQASWPSLPYRCAALTRAWALCLLRLSERGWADDDLLAGQVLADRATGCLVNISERARQQRVASELAEALGSRLRPLREQVCLEFNMALYVPLAPGFGAANDCNG